jgi:hypothetical protein
MKRFYVAATLLCTLLLASLTALAQTQSPDEKKAAEAKRAEFKKKAQTLVASKKERAKYAYFLKAPNTGLIRLLPRERYITESYAEATGRSAAPATTVATPGSFQRKNAEDLSSTVASELPAGQAPRGGTPSAPNPPALTNTDDVPRLDSAPRSNKRGGARDGGAYYSFTLLTHAYGYGSDLALERGQFGVGFAGADYGFITNLGDVPLESISLDTPEAKRLAAYPRARQESDARLEFRRFQRGAEIDGVKVKSWLPMQLNSTYLLRAINYAETDVLVAFKVVEIDAEGTPLILWKLLKRYSNPRRAW